MFGNVNIMTKIAGAAREPDASGWNSTVMLNVRSS